MIVFLTQLSWPAAVVICAVILGAVVVFLVERANP